jgi:hypothetical protein
MIDKFDERCFAAFPIVAFIANRHIIDHMRRLCQTLDMDLETVMLWGIVAHMNVAKLIVPGAPASEVLNSDGSFASELHSVRLSDITLVSGFPRETVRRKLELLRKKNRLCRNDDGSWVVCRSKHDVELVKFTVDNIRRLVNTAKEVEAVLAKVEL